MDQELQCIDKEKNVDCEGTFIFTQGEQEFYEKKGYGAPKRCPSCRTKKKARFADQDRDNRSQRNNTSDY